MISALFNPATQARLFRFIIVGILVGAMNFSILAVLKKRCDPSIAFSAAFILSTSLHYLLNRFWALPSDRRDVGRQFGEYALTVLISYVMNFGLFTLGHSVFGLSVIWAAACAVPPASLAVFLLLSFRVFRTKA